MKIADKISDYLKWMEAQGYAQSTQDGDRRRLNRFFKFVKRMKIKVDDFFTLETLEQFHQTQKDRVGSPIKRFAQYLHAYSEIPEPFKRKLKALPPEYEQYLNYYRNRCQDENPVQAARRILSGFNAYLEKSATNLHQISIEQIDRFLALYTKGFAPRTCKLQRSYLKGFLKHLYQQGHIKKNLAALVYSAPEFARSTPPKFLRPEQIQKLFNNIDFFSRRGLRANAVLHLAYYIGLRPKEIRLITLDDISFRQKEISIKTRKNFSPMQLPLPDNVIKSITAYIVGSRPESKSRYLFLQIVTPHKPIQNSEIYHDVRGCMEKNNIKASVYWLRHSYAQNLLEAGASIYEIKEMMGHKDIESTRKYLRVHINLMRKVIIDETI